jgi:hypothetical protein
MTKSQPTSELLVIFIETSFLSISFITKFNPIPVLLSPLKLLPKFETSQKS